MTSTIFLVHGFSSSARMSWDRNGWLDLLADAGRDVIAPDLLGHGEAPKPHDPAAYAFVEELAYGELGGAGAVDAVGFSMGARVALTIEADHPGTFGRIVVGGLGSNLFAPRDPEPAALAIEGKSEATDPLLRAFRVCRIHPPERPQRVGGLLARRQAQGVARGSRWSEVSGADRRREQGRRREPVEPLSTALESSQTVTIPGADHLGTMKGYGFLEAAFGFLGVEVR